MANKVAAFGTILSDRLTSALAPLSPSAASILLTLSCWGALTATKIAAIVGVTQPTAVRVIAGLTAAGLVRKTASGQRTVPFVLTAQGQRKARELQGKRIEVANALLANLPKARLRAFEDGIDHLLAGATDSRRRARISCRFCDHGRCTGPLCPVGTQATALEGPMRVTVVQ